MPALGRVQRSRHVGLAMAQLTARFFEALQSAPIVRGGPRLAVRVAMPGSQGVLREAVQAAEPPDAARTRTLATEVAQMLGDYLLG